MPQELMRPSDLRSYQYKAINWMVRRKHAGLLIEMGLGKTICALSALHELLASKHKHRGALVIAPMQVCEEVWEQEAQRWHHTRDRFRFVKMFRVSAKKRQDALYTEDGDIYLLNVESVPWLSSQLLNMKKRAPFDILIVDESSMFKNTATERFRSLRQILCYFSRRYILTGTPTPNCLSELWPQMYILDQGERLGYSHDGFVSRFFTQDEETMVLMPRQGTVETLQEAISDVCLQVSGAVDLPDRIDATHWVTLPQRARDLYDTLEREFFIELDAYENAVVEAGHRGVVEAMNVLALRAKCHQMANGAVFDSEDRTVYHEIHTEKLDALETIVNASAGAPVLVAYSYRHDRERIQKRFGPVPYIGGGNRDSKKAIADWNARKLPMLLLHPRSGGHGLNLQFGGHILVLFSLLWSNEMYRQLIRRLQRPGQTSPFVSVLHIQAHDTLDEVMRYRLGVKGRTEQEFLMSLRAYQRRRGI